LHGRGGLGLTTDSCIECKTICRFAIAPGVFLVNIAATRTALERAKMEMDAELDDLGWEDDEEMDTTDAAAADSSEPDDATSTAAQGTAVDTAGLSSKDGSSETA
jgi:hypothetical protein